MKALSRFSWVLGGVVTFSAWGFSPLPVELYQMTSVGIPPYSSAHQSLSIRVYSTGSVMGRKCVPVQLQTYPPTNTEKCSQKELKVLTVGELDKLQDLAKKSAEGTFVGRPMHAPNCFIAPTKLVTYWVRAAATGEASDRFIYTGYESCGDYTMNNSLEARTLIVELSKLAREFEALPAE